MADCLETVLKRQRLLAGPAGRRVGAMSHFRQRYGLSLIEQPLDFAIQRMILAVAHLKYVSEFQMVSVVGILSPVKFLPKTGSK